MKLTRNIVTVCYEDTNSVAFCIPCEYGHLTLDDLKKYCDFYFSYLFPDEGIDSKIIPTVGHFTRIEVDTPLGLKKLSWGFNTTFEDFVPQTPNKTNSTIR